MAKKKKAEVVDSSKSIRLPSVCEQLKKMQEDIAGIKLMFVDLVGPIKKRLSNLEELAEKSCCEKPPRLLQKTTTRFPDGTTKTEEHFSHY